MTPPLPVPAHQPRHSRIRQAWAHPLLAPLNSAEAWGRLASVVNPSWSVVGLRARVVRVVDEAPGVKSVWFKPNARFKGFRPGQHVLLELEINGARHARCFSISHAPRADRLLRLTIKRKDDGPVSAAAHALRPGHVVRLSQAQGEFAPRGPSSKLFLLSAGSGVTPMISLLHAMADAASMRDVVVVHGDRSDADALFSQELRELAARLPQLRLHLHSSKTQGALDAVRIAQYVPDWAERETLMCGPDGFMRNVEKLYADAGREQQLQSESFGRRAAPIDPEATAHRIICADARSGKPEQVFTTVVGETLLNAAEAAGLRPRFGCRRGICRTCQCLKRSGTVTNLLTGQRSGPGEELIQLCISTPQSAIELAL